MKYLLLFNLLLLSLMAEHLDTNTSTNILQNEDSNVSVEVISTEPIPKEDDNSTSKETERPKDDILVVEDESGFSDDEIRNRAKETDSTKAGKVSVGKVINAIDDKGQVDISKIQEKWEDLSPSPLKYDWVQTKSGEWFKGEIQALYDGNLEFDSDEVGTVLVKDIRVGTEETSSDGGGKEAPSRAISTQTTGLSSNPSNLINLNGLLLFNAYTDEHGWELWKSDGTADGTLLIKDIIAGSENFLPSDFHIVSNLLLFKPNWGNGLWVTDGTAIGTQEILSFSNYNTRIYSSVLMNNKLYFAVRNVDTGSAAILYESDGTVNGTVIIKDLIPGYNGINMNNPTLAGNKFYFQARENTVNNDWVLWVSDGTANGTKVVKTTNNENIINPSNFTALGNIIYFSGSTSSNTYGVELWKSDGTPEGTELVKDIYVDGTSGSYPDYINSIGNNIYFRANDGTQTALWISDGTTEGTTLLHTMNYSYPDEYIGLDDKVLFSFDSGSKGEELWVSDTTTSGTTLLKDINSVSTSALELSTEFVKAGDKHYFTTYDDDEGKTELWVTDSNNTDITSLGIYSDIYLSSSAVLDNKLVLFMGNSGYTLKITDGTLAGTEDLGSYDDVEETIVVADDKIFFIADDSSLGTTLHMSDGTANGTDVFRGPDNDTYPDASYLATAGDKLFFSYYVNNTGNYRMYTTDGTALGTTVLLDENSSINFSDFVGVDDTLFFKANEEHTDDTLNHGSELWISDGTVNGTHLLKNIASDTEGEQSSYPTKMLNVNGALYFLADDQVHGEELWKSDGTEAGTLMVKDIREGEDSSDYKLRATVGNYFYFTTSSAECCGSDLLWATNTDTNVTEQIDLDIAGEFNMREIDSSNDNTIHNYEGYWLLWLDMYDKNNHKVLKKITGTKVETLQDVIIGSNGGKN